MAINVRLLKANHGDCILASHISEDETFNHLIDGGNPASYKHGPNLRYEEDLCVALNEIKAANQVVDLTILTHIDDDHIGGLLQAFKTPNEHKSLFKKNFGLIHQKI